MRDHGVHEAVMVDQVINNLIADKKGTMSTDFWFGGHAFAILKKLDSEAKLTGIDRDSESLLKANEVLEKDKRFSFINEKFWKYKKSFCSKEFGWHFS
ncbi:MAG: hypothetical protein CM1200mP12_15910 [Gammaproteobacteria bacterium]|nr:MAG: hypothetical protein CM1200mP12_15910 [Gammaproteobacteria bacterium]